MGQVVPDAADWNESCQSRWSIPADPAQVSSSWREERASSSRSRAEMVM